MPASQSFTGGGETVTAVQEMSMCACAWGFALHLLLSSICPLLLQLARTTSLPHLASSDSRKKKKGRRKVKQLYISYTERQKVLWAEANNKGNADGRARKP